MYGNMVPIYNKNKATLYIVLCRSGHEGALAVSNVKVKRGAEGNIIKVSLTAS